MSIEMLSLRCAWGRNVAVLTVNMHIAGIYIGHSFILRSSAKEDEGVGLVGITGVRTLASREGSQKSGPQCGAYHPGIKRVHPQLRAENVLICICI
jgi:hypothetical protein